MFGALRKLWNGIRAVPAEKCPRSKRRPSYRPWLEPLEGRELPALLGNWFMPLALPPPVAPPPAAPIAVPMPHETTSRPPGVAAPIRVTVPQNSPATVIDMAPVFATVPGLQHQDGLRLSVLGNTNPGLVRTALSDSALTLNYSQARTGTANIVLCATDADGVSVSRALQVTVIPMRPASAVGGWPMPAPPPMPAPMPPPMPAPLPTMPLGILK